MGSDVRSRPSVRSAPEYVHEAEAPGARRAPQPGPHAAAHHAPQPAPRGHRVRAAVRYGGAAAVVVLGAVLAAAGCRANTNADADENPKDHAAFAAPDGRLTIATDNSRITLRPSSDAGRVGVRRWSSGWSVGGSTRPGWRMRGHTLRLACGDAGVINHCKARFEVRVPEGLPITVRGVNARVTGQGLRSADVTVTTGDAPVTLRFSRDPRHVAVRAGNGPVAVHVPADGTGYRVRAAAAHGPVRDRVTSTAAGNPNDATGRTLRTITASTGRGSVLVDRKP